MKIEKIETNLKRKLFLFSTNPKLLPNQKNIEQSVIRINSNITFQECIGFGGALTESSCYLLSTISKEISNKILDEYFEKDSLNYNFCRLSIGSCDFSLNSYSYSYKKDLSDFTISRDLKYVIPIIKSIKNRNNKIKIISSPWSPPAFMKDNSILANGGKLLPHYKKLWADILFLKKMA